MNDNKKYSKEHIEFLQKVKRKKKAILLTQIAILVLFFSLWEIAARLKLIDTFLTSSPSEMWKLFLKLLFNGSLLKHIGISIFETVVGFILGTFLGTLIAILLWWSDFISKVLDPYMVVLNALPKTALAPIIIVWVGAGISGIIVTALMISLVVTILGVYSGFKQVQESKIKMLKTFGATKIQILQKVIIPASIPTIINALKINVGLSWVGVIVGEFMVSRAGIGYLIVYGSQIFRFDIVMTSVIILSILATAMYQGVVYLEKKLLNWRR
ncbi:NitT/TauT family transport system permease protein [Caminicella sporogenes DSM 14501]|uniref:NitT/TauT family transport system permease protein n=1 Tax=Caminicella sporogenes DSM 14501 TaxID=1121266 RepID=A0A1M6P422_9FIRM|nr:ABC transporter permease [Caminicella sporogenes]RKD21537.1 sulfonate ABC transporter permease [Caminicella sporogenes]WIF94187.1 ABC transporter permease [Caminicella sporogenes]SHK02671.1 NitT/TauT family transport system permease protein [Caminicella sporogenes DSM 14501]